jgi:hypothetical protein
MPVIPSRRSVCLPVGQGLDRAPTAAPTPFYSPSASLINLAWYICSTRTCRRTRFKDTLYSELLTQGSQSVACIKFYDPDPRGSLMHDNLGTEFQFDTRVPTRACYQCQTSHSDWYLADRHCSKRSAADSTKRHHSGEYGGTKTVIEWLWLHRGGKVRRCSIHIPPRNFASTHAVRRM